MLFNNQKKQGRTTMYRSAGTLTLACLATLFLSACTKEEAPVGPPASRPVKVFTVEGGSAAAIRRFPARVDASQRAELSFRVSGQLAEIKVREGDMVQQGDLVARLDPTDYEIVLEDRTATFDNAQRNFARGKELIVDGNISRRDYDRMEADFRTATAALNAAKKDMDYTEMRAPFDGRIAQRVVENFEEVLAKQTVFFLQDVGFLDVIIDLSESLIRSLRANSAHQQRDIDREPAITAVVGFEDRPGASFPLTIKEIATRANDETQTYPVTFTMRAPEDFTVLPGMTAQVEVDFSKIIVNDAAKWVPARAVQADGSLSPRVWVLDSDSMTVSSQAVVIGRMSGSMVQVTDGLNGGEEIVSVGSPYLAEGMKVTRMAQTEQAQPRADDPS
jgi:RND family efflux transporter MFP subunit